jgi:transposase
MQEALFCQALGLTSPWAVERVALDVERSRIDLYVVWQARSAPCPACGAIDQKLHDHRQRSWRHLDFFQFEAHVHCQLPRVACSGCGAITQLKVPWAREGSRFTLLFEALGLTLAREMPVAACARILRCADNALWRQIDAHVQRARAQESYARVIVIGIDETSCAKGQHYITLVHDLEQARLIYATPGKDASTVERFVGDFKTHKGKPEAIEVVCMDMSKAFIAGTAEHLPAAAVAFDGFHVVQLANRAVDAVRREEARGEHWLKKTRWCWLKDKGRWTPKERDKMDWLPHTRLKTARAWRLKEALRDIYKNWQIPSANGSFIATKSEVRHHRPSSRTRSRLAHQKSRGRRSLVDPIGPRLPRDAPPLSSCDRWRCRALPPVPPVRAGAGFSRPAGSGAPCSAPG